MVNPFLRKARKKEEYAFRMEQLEYKNKSKSKRLSNAYMEAVEEYERNGYLERAISNCKDALKFAPKQDEDEIEKKLNELEKKKKGGGLGSKLTFAIPAIICLVGALIFTSFNLTGYAIGGLAQNSSQWIGVCLFACGLIFTFFYFKIKKSLQTPKKVKLSLKVKA